MAIDPQLLADVQLHHGPNDLSCLLSISRHGILPGDQVRQVGGVRTYGGASASRDGHVYLGTPEYVHRWASSAKPVLRVDLAQLDPRHLVADEDHFAIYSMRKEAWDLHRKLAKQFPDEFALASSGAPTSPHRVVWRRSTAQIARPPRWGQRTVSLGQWASRPRNAAFLARPDAAAFSLAHGSLAHVGPIKPRALSIDHDMLTQHLRSFVAGHEQREQVIEALLILEDNPLLRAQHAQALHRGSHTNMPVEHIHARLLGETQRVAA